LRLIIFFFLRFLFNLSFFFLLFFFRLIKLSFDLTKTLEGILKVLKVFNFLDILVNVIHREFRGRVDLLFIDFFHEFGFLGLFPDFDTKRNVGTLKNITPEASNFNIILRFSLFSNTK